MWLITDIIYKKKIPDTNPQLFCKSAPRKIMIKPMKVKLAFDAQRESLARMRVGQSFFDCVGTELLPVCKPENGDDFTTPI